MKPSALSGVWLLMATQSAHAQSGAAPTTGMGQMLAGLAAVIGLVLALAWVARRMGLQAPTQSPLLRRIATLAVGTRERIVIVEAGDRWLVVGVTAQNIQTLHTLPKGEIPDTPTMRLGGGFAALLQKARTQNA